MHTFKKFFLILLLLVLSSGVLVSPSFAHVLETEGSIGAVMHIDPQDDPTAGVVSTIFLEFKDTEGHFSAENCECTVSILQAEKPIYSQSLSKDSLSPTFTYTFPKAGKYDMHVSGNPQNGAAFQPFTLHYDIQVGKAEAKPTTIIENASSTKQGENKFPLPYIIGGTIVIIGIAVFSLVSYFKKK